MRLRITVAAIALMLLAGACSAGESESGQTLPDTGSSDAAAPNDVGTGTKDASSDDTLTAAGTTAPVSGDVPTATVTLENGETFSFSIWCVLEHEGTDAENFLFSLGSNLGADDGPILLQVSQFTPDAGGLATVTLADSSTYETLWEASTRAGDDLVLQVNGNIVTGSGDFHNKGVGDPGFESVRGELLANC